MGGVEARVIRRLPLAGGPVDLGAEHGAAFRDEIRRYTEERVRLASDGSWAGRAATREDALGLARAMLPAHRAYAPDHDRGLLWNDPALGIDWPVDKADAILSERDRSHPTLAELPVFFRHE